MGKASRFVGVFVLCFGAAKVALAHAEGPPLPPLESSPPGTQEPLEQDTTLTWADLEQLFEESWVAVAGPPEATPEELVQTILADTTLPSHIRDPFVALAQAKAKAPHLLAQEGTSP